MYTLLDSNIIIYSIVKDSPKKDLSQKFIKENQIILSISHQVILESLRVLTHPKFKNPMDYKGALKSVWTIVDALSIVSPNPETIYITRELIAKYRMESNRIFDAYLVATAISNGIKIIATDNTKHFKIFDEIKVLNPFRDSGL